MIFSKGLHLKVLSGQKTQTRRLVKEGDRASRMWRDPVTLIPDETLYKFISRVKRRGRVKWEVGKTYAIQPKRGVKGNGRFRITKIRKERLQDISWADIRAEGFPPTEAEDTGYHVPEGRERFASLWDSIHKKSGDRWEDNTEVWVLEIEPVRAADG